MSTKAEKTKEFIIKTSAPIFSKQGYVGTSMSDITQATGLTKGALYGNFKNKEEIALAAFEHNTNKLLAKIDERLEIEGNSLDKIFSLTSFYRQYAVFTLDMGGCPIINVGVDAEYNNKTLSGAAKEIVRTIEGKIAAVLETGVNKNELKLPVSPLQFAKQLYTMLQGSVAMATVTQDRKYLLNTVTYINHLIEKEVKI
ncbi:TetR/AcrR family transcriptional regulator [Cellulophaga fucicola]|uniref:TetR/AcrR family transcriptional regulator n=1 Tax=Cellulophaga fucicola TaxID=76595 RepID=UPI003EBBF4CB